MNAGDARLMRAIRRELMDRIVPELQTADARERVTFMAAVLDFLAADLDVLPALATEAVPKLRETLEDALALLPASDPGQIAKWRRSLAAIEGQRDASPARAIDLLRELAASMVRGLADIPADQLRPGEEIAIGHAQSLIAAADRHWLRTFEAERDPKSRRARMSETSRSALLDPVTPAVLTQYLRRSFPESPLIAARSATPIAGGRSKRTILIDLENSASVPSRIVMRQDMYHRPGGSSVSDEVKPLRLLSELGLPAPSPIHFEPQATELGPPFLLVEHIDGKVPGSYFGMDDFCPLAFLDLARMLARLHRIVPRDIGLRERTARHRHGPLGDQVEEYWSQWRKNSIRASPIVESAYAWARREYAASTGSSALVHGDCGPHNLLVRDGRLTGLLDWEFMHVGDPAEDLGIARVYAETIMPWTEFMQAYRDAGGADVAEGRIHLGLLLHYLKGTALVAASARNFAEGTTDEFTKGANSFTGLRRIEMKIVEFFEQLGN